MWSDSEGEQAESRVSAALAPAPAPPAAAGAAAVAAAAAAAAAAPRIAHLNVSENSRMHIGPKFVSVTQNVRNTEVIKGRAAGLVLEAEADAGARRLRCSVAVFLCWALAVAAGLAFFVARRALARPPDLLDLDITEPWYLRRGDWQAMPPYGRTFLELPARYVLVGHSATAWCDERYECIAKVLAIQREHLRRGWDDIGPNFLVGGDGSVFEGRGANVLGAMVRSWNARSVTLMFVGDYRRGRDAPAAAQLRHAAALLAALVRAGALHPRYALLAQCQLVPLVYTPGRQLLARLHLFDHWDSRNASGCLDG